MLWLGHRVDVQVCKQRVKQSCKVYGTKSSPAVYESPTASHPSPYLMSSDSLILVVEDFRLSRSYVTPQFQRKGSPGLTYFCSWPELAQPPFRHLLINYSLSSAASALPSPWVLAFQLTALCLKYGDGWGPVKVISDGCSCSGHVSATAASLSGTVKRWWKWNVLCRQSC